MLQARTFAKKYTEYYFFNNNHFFDVKKKLD